MTERAIKTLENEPLPSTVMTPMAMIDRAIASGAGIETLERLMALQERWEATQAKKVYDEAMKAAQEEMRPVLPNADNSQTKSRYATYPSNLYKTRVFAEFRHGGLPAPGSYSHCLRGRLWRP